jgi:riboflavin transporter FmnP
LNSKKISLVIVFAALAAFLNLSPIKIPAPYAPFLIYQVWEIPIVTVAILYGFSLGLAVSIINTLVLLAVFPGALPTGPIYNLIAVLSMLLGVYAAKVLTTIVLPTKNYVITVAAFTAIGTILRVVVMTLVNWIVLPYPPPIGFSMPEDVTVGLLPVIAFFNGTLALYTVPLGVALARAIKNRVASIGA